MPEPAKPSAGSWMLHAYIRDATNLTAGEKLLLHTIASHKTSESFGTRETLMRWTGLSERRFRRAVHGVVHKGAVLRTGRPGRTTKYRIRGAALKRLAREQTSPVRATTVVTAPDHSEQTHADHSDPAARDRSGLLKENLKANPEDIKNMKMPRRVRRPQQKARQVPVERTMDERKERLLERLAERRQVT